MFNSCHKLIQQIRQDGLNGSNKERQLAKSVVAALVNSLQELSNNFKTSQGDYLRSKIIALLFRTLFILYSAKVLNLGFFCRVEFKRRALTAIF